MEWDDDPIVCTTHVSHIPCRKGHVGDDWGVGCEFSTDPYVVAIVGAWHRGWIDEGRNSLPQSKLREDDVTSPHC